MYRFSFQGGFGDWKECVVYAESFKAAQDKLNAVFEGMDAYKFTSSFNGLEELGLEELKDDTYKEGFDAGFSSGLREGKRLHETLQTKKQSK